MYPLSVTQFRAVLLCNFLETTCQSPTVSSKVDNENYLTDLKNERTGEQIVFEQKVFWANEAFKCRMNNLILWHKSPMECRQYPEKSQANKCTYRKHAHLFEYDKHKKVLCKKVKNSDGIGKSAHYLTQFKGIVFITIYPYLITL